VKDLTENSVTLHILKMAAPVGTHMLVYISYQLINLHFISRIGTEAVAGFNISMSIIFAVTAMTNMVGVGTASLVSQGAGRKDLHDVRLVLHQALALAAVGGFATLSALYLFMPIYLKALSADAAVVDAGLEYLAWVCPSYALLFLQSTLTATLRGVGVVTTPTSILITTVFLNAILAFLLIPGRGPIPPLGVAGAGMATTLATAIGLLSTWIYMHRAEPTLAVRRALLVPKLQTWRRILAVGLPSGMDLILMFLSTAVIYALIRDQGASIQAGFGIGHRVLQIILLPGLAVAIAAGPITGQNLGARKVERIREVFRSAASIGALIMLAITLLVQWKPMIFVQMFDTDAATAATAQLFLQTLSWTFIAQGLVYTCTYIFQGLGNTLPALMSAVARFSIFCLCALWLSQQPNFHAEQVWYALAASVLIQAGLSLWLLHLELKRTLRPLLDNA
jgi:putative MATE family efflux protein